MNLYFRLIWLLLRLRWMPKLKNPLDIATLHMHVFPNDLDVYLHVNNGRYLSMMDLGRVHYMNAIGLLKPTLEKKWSPLVGSIKTHFLKSLNLFDKLTMTTQVVYWDDKWFYIEQKIFKKDQLCVLALIKGLFISKEGKIPPEAVFTLLDNPPPRPPIPHALEQWIQAEKATNNQ